MTIIQRGQLVELAQNNQMPEFVYATWKGSKEVLLRAPRSAWKIPANILATIALIITFFGAIAMVHLGVPKLILGGVCVVAIIFAVIAGADTVNKEAQQEREGKLLREIGLYLGSIAEWTHRTPVELKEIGPFGLHGLIDEMMTLHCVDVLVAQRTPTSEWEPRRSELLTEFRKRFDMLLPLGFMPAGGPNNAYRNYFKKAEEWLLKAA